MGTSKYISRGWNTHIAFTLLSTSGEVLNSGALLRCVDEGERIAFCRIHFTRERRVFCRNHFQLLMTCVMASYCFDNILDLKVLL